MNRLLELIGLAFSQSMNPELEEVWFIKFLGHLNKIELRYYPEGWILNSAVPVERCEASLKDDFGIIKACEFLQKRINTSLS